MEDMFILTILMVLLNPIRYNYQTKARTAVAIEFCVRGQLYKNTIINPGAGFGNLINTFNVRFRANLYYCIFFFSSNDSSNIVHILNRRIASSYCKSCIPRTLVPECPACIHAYQIYYMNISLLTCILFLMQVVLMAGL